MLIKNLRPTTIATLLFIPVYSHTSILLYFHFEKKHRPTEQVPCYSY